MGRCLSHVIFLWSLIGFATANFAPIFFNLPARLTLREDETVGNKLFTMFAFDFDTISTPEGRIHYILTPIDHTDFRFSVDASLGDMYLVQSLDYETKKSYTLTAEVADVGTPPLFQRKNIYVDVLDVNDNSPSCRAPNVIGSLKEDADVGSSIATLECTDPDTGDGGKIDFEIVGGDSDVIEVSSTGEATLKRTVDYDTEKDTYEVDVKVKDRGSPQLFSMAKVILSLEDIDDSVPVFSQPGGYAENIVENSPLGTTVLVLTATDDDAPNTEASRVHFGLETTPTPDWINVDPFSGSIIVKGNIDWEMSPVIECDVYVHSSDRFAERVIVHVTITVDDVNDGIPTFDQEYYEITINESVRANITVAIINATDLDDGPDGEVKYTIEGNSIFRIDENTGVISLQQAPDYEVKKSYLVTVVAQDGGNPATSSAVFVQVSILPENEFSPVFIAPFTFDVSEDLAPGSSVFTIITSDGDDGLDGLIGYRVINDGVPFLVDSGTGVIRVAYNLDYETTTSYNMTIEAVDNSTTIRRSAQQTFLINIVDANDVAAVCEYVPTQILKYPFLANVPILTVVCTDVDTEASGLTYNISRGNDGTFKVENNGHFMIRSPPLKSRYDLTVEVDDGGGQITSVSFTVFTETELTFQNLPEIIVVNESSSLATPSYHTNPGYAFPPVLSRFILGNEEHHLILRPGSGDIVFALDFDRDIRDNYTYVIEAVSGSGQNSTQSFMLRIVDLNDNAPKFTTTAFQFKLSENLPVGSDVYLFVATDLDSGDNADVSYSIPSGNEDGVFAINSTGWLSIVAPLHYERKRMHVLEIEASDSGSPSLTGTTTVVITVIDEKEDDPEIIAVSGKNEVQISEDAVLGSVVFQLTLPISNIPDAVTFSILTGNEFGYFGIASTSGKIYLAKMLDRESLPFFSFSLEMAAVNQNGSIVQGNMNITIRDVNDNYPKFSKTIYLMDIQHGEAAGTKAGEVDVSDADEGENANVTLKIIGGNTGSAFSFSGNELITLKEMDYHTVKSYSLLVQAADNGVPALSSHTVVFVKVIPQEFFPSFASPNETITIEESTRVGTHIFDTDATALGASETDGTLKYEIKSGNGLSHFSIDEGSGVLTLVKSLNYEADSTFTLQIVSIYTLDNLKRDQVTLTIDVANVNEFTPTFDQSAYHWTVSELEKLNFTVGSVTVVDEDCGPFGDFIITLSGTADFQIDSDSNPGNIFVAQSLDFLRQNLYTLTVMAVDQGIPIKSSVASITIEIVDENNHYPSFTQANYSTQMYSLIPLGSEVFHVQAEDLDTGENGDVTYTIISDSSAGKFLLNSKTGIVTTAAQSDVVTYFLEIEAKDDGSPPKSDTANLEINVLPGYGENLAPIFTAGAVADVTTSRKVSPGYVVITLEATDVDVDNLTYYIVSGNEGGFFLMDEVTGALSTATHLTMALNQYSLVVNVYDDGKPRESDSITVNIDINPPRTDSVTVDYSFPASEDIGSGHLIGSILVDPGRTPLDYAIVSGNHGNAFRIEMDGLGEGLLKRQNQLDYEDFSLFSLQIRVITDLRNLTKIVEVVVADVNDEPPYFPTTSLRLPLAEHMPIGHTLTKIEYEDDDFTESNRLVTFSISNSGDTFLNIDASGQLTLVRSPDFDTTQQFSATVTVSQAAFTPATLDIIVDVLDVEETQIVETPPSGRATFISLELPHRVDTHFLVHKLTLANFGIDAAASQEFVSFDVSPPFSVDQSTGDITVTKPNVLKAGKSYFRWIVCRTPSESVMALVRLDVYNRDGHMVVIEFGDSMDTVKANKQKFLNRAQAFFDNFQRVGVSLIFPDDSPSVPDRRKLLSTSSQVGLYALSDDSVDSLGQVQTQKEFLSQSQLLEKLQESGDGTPVSGLSNPSLLTVVSVVGYRPASQEEVPFVATAAGIAMLTLLALLLVGGGLALYICVKKHCFSDSKDLMSDQHNRFKQTTTTTIGGTDGFQGKDKGSQKLRRQGTIVVKGGYETHNNTTMSEGPPTKHVRPLLVKVNSSTQDKHQDTTNISANDENRACSVTQHHNSLTNKTAMLDRIKSTSSPLEGKDNPAFSHEENKTKGHNSVSVSREKSLIDSATKTEGLKRKELTFVVVTQPESEPYTEKGSKPNTPPSPLSPTRHVTPTLFPTVEDADDNDGIERVIVPDPVTSRRGSAAS